MNEICGFVVEFLLRSRGVSRGGGGVVNPFFLLFFENQYAQNLNLNLKKSEYPLQKILD